jgi:hypothetical protein
MLCSQPELICFLSRVTATLWTTQKTERGDKKRPHILTADSDSQNFGEN